jgi:hypothetical protein
MESVDIRTRDVDGAAVLGDMCIVATTLDEQARVHLKF